MQQQRFRCKKNRKANPHVHTIDSSRSSDSPSDALTLRRTWRWGGDVSRRPGATPPKVCMHDDEPCMQTASAHSVVGPQHARTRLLPSRGAGLLGPASGRGRAELCTSCFVNCDAIPGFVNCDTWVSSIATARGASPPDLQWRMRNANNNTIFNVILHYLTREIPSPHNK